jgi:hypothetical protein
VDLTEGLVMAAATCETDAYKTKQSFAWVRAIGDDLMAREQALLMVAHLGKMNKHWVGLGVDAQEKAIHYGDSLRSHMPSGLSETYQWWISQHSSSAFTFKDLPIMKQEDSVFCGIISDNGLNNFALPDITPLMKSSEVRAGKMSAFIRVANHILKSVVIL